MKMDKINKTTLTILTFLLVSDVYSSVFIIQSIAKNEIIVQGHSYNIFIDQLNLIPLLFQT